MLTHCWLKQYIASIIHVINVPEWYIELCCGAITKTWQLLSCCLVNHQVWNVSYIKRLKTYPKQNEDCCKYKKSEVKLNIPVLLHYIAYAVEHGFPELCGSPTRLRIKHILQGPTNQKKKNPSPTDNMDSVSDLYSAPIFKYIWLFQGHILQHHISLLMKPFACWPWSDSSPWFTQQSVKANAWGHTVG